VVLNYTAVVKARRARAARRHAPAWRFRFNATARSG
jgi:hypothetical protein